MPALFFLAVSTANGTTCGEFCFDFVNLILVANTNVYTALCGTTYVQYVALATVYFSAAEFVILNIFMLLAVLLYVAIQVFIQNARFLKAAVDYAELAKAGIAAGFVLRSQSQNIQLARTTAVKFFLKKTPKGLKIPGKRTVTREAAKD